jgi:hypothetical protein
MRALPSTAALAERANFRHAQWQIGEAIADIFAEVVRLMPELADTYRLDQPNWKALAAKWRKN